MALSPELLAAIAERRPLATLVTIVLPASAGGDLLLSDRPFVSAAAGAFEPRITTLGKLTRRLSGPDGQLDTPTVQITVTDIGTEAVPVWRVGRSGRRLDGAPVVIQWGAEGVAPEKWSTRFTGYVVSRRTAGRGESQITCRVDDRWLSRPVGPRITVDVWPTAATQAEGGTATGAEQVLGLRAPIAYGTCDSAGLGSHGLRKALFVQTEGTPWRWLYSIGDCAIDTVYVEGKPVDPADWTRTVEFRGGWLWTTVDFAEHPGEDDGEGGHKVPAVTADGDGLDVSTFGATGSPVAQLRYLLESFGRGWDGQGLTAVATLTDDTTWEALEAFATANGDEGAGVLAGGSSTTTLRDVLKDMLRAWGWSAYWTREGRLAVIPEQWARDVPPPAPGVDVWLVEGENMLDPLDVQDEDADARGKGTKVRYCPGPDGTPLLEVVALDPSHLDEEPEEITVPAGPQRVV